MPRTEQPAKRQHALTVLRHRDFRLLWCGQLVSTTGQQMQTVALAWHVLELTDSTFQVGLIAFFGIVPFLVLSLLGGAIADRLDRKKIILASQSATMLTTIVLVAATAAGFATPALIYAIAFVSGATRAFDAPARQALIPNLVPASELAGALTLNTMLRQMATIFGPGIGGVVIGLAGLSAAYAINAATFLAVIGALLLMGPVPGARQVSARGADLVLGGLRFARNEPVVLSLLSLDFLVTVLGSTRALLPALGRSTSGLRGSVSSTRRRRRGRSQARSSSAPSAPGGGTPASSLSSPPPSAPARQASAWPSTSRQPWPCCSALASRTSSARSCAPPSFSSAPRTRCEAGLRP